MAPPPRSSFLPPLATVLLVMAGLPAWPVPLAEVEEYQVLRAFLGSSLAEKGPYSLYDHLGIYFIYNVDPQKTKEIDGFFRQYAGITLESDLVAGFVAANRIRVHLDPRRFPAGTRFSTQYLKADVYSLSRVGFNVRRDKALMYASFASLTEDGHGSLVYLEKRAGAWTVVKGAAVWMYGASVHPFNP
jgi:hypothetical protein